MNKFEKQRDILFEACKKVATNQRTPQWISGVLTKAVMDAKAVNDEFPETLECKQTHAANDIHIDVIGEITAIDNTTYTVQVIAESDSVEGVKLVHVKIIKGNGPRQVNSVIYNVPETWICNAREE